jgi:hypothetical protein
VRSRQPPQPEKRLPFAAALALAVALATPSALAKPPPAHVAVQDPPIFPLSQVARGVEGKGWTVFESHLGPEEFRFVVLGVLRSYLGPGEDLIIAELRGKKIERTGVISGMSGSPVYVDGKLVGAVGYRFGAFTDRPIAGITPIERMLTARSTPKLAATSPASGPPRRFATTAWGVAEPIAIPIAVTGLSARVAAAFSDELAERGYGPLVPGASAAAVRKPKAKAEPFYASGPIAGLIVDGDLRMAGIGTVTWVKGKRFLAFGHPFLGYGSSEMPVSNAEIVTTVASEAGSWKMGQATTPVGMLTDDRLHAIAGDMGRTPRTVPVDVTLGFTGPRVKSDALDKMSFSVMRHPTDTPLFAAIALANALASRVGVEPGGTLTTRGTVKLSSGHVHRFESRLADDSAGLEVAAAIALLGELAVIVDQPYADVQIEHVSLRVEREVDVHAARILSVDADGRLAAGSEATLRVRMQPHQSAVTERTIKVRLPAGVSEGRWVLWAVDRRKAVQMEKEAGLRRQPVDLDGFLRERGERPLQGTVTLYLSEERDGLRVDGEGLPGLPPSLVGLLGEGGGQSATLLEKRILRLGTADLPGVVVGAARARVRVASPEENP